MSLTTPAKPLIYKHRNDEEIIAVIEYREVEGGYIPFSVQTVRAGDHNWCASTFDVEWCKRDGCCYYHQSGWGGGMNLSSFVDRNAGVPIWFNRELLNPCHNEDDDETETPLRDDEIEAMGYRIVPAPLPLLGGPGVHPLEDSYPYEVTESETEYCGICGDHLPSDSNRPCNHLCDSDGEYYGAGTIESDWDYCKASFHRVLDFLEHTFQLRTALQSDYFTASAHGYPYYCRTPKIKTLADRPYCQPELYQKWEELIELCADGSSDVEEKYEKGIAWLLTLERFPKIGEPSPTHRANLRTVQWIDEWITLNWL